MQAAEVEKLVSDQLENVDVSVSVEGSHYQVVVVGDIFDGLNAVKKQQLVYGCLNAYIIDGTIHAVIIKTYTNDEWSKLQG